MTSISRVIKRDASIDKRLDRRLVTQERRKIIRDKDVESDEWTIEVSKENGLNIRYRYISIQFTSAVKTNRFSGEVSRQNGKDVQVSKLLKLAGKVILLARYIIIQIAAPLKNIELFNSAFY